MGSGGSTPADGADAPRPGSANRRSFSGRGRLGSFSGLAPRAHRRSFAGAAPETPTVTQSERSRRAPAPPRRATTISAPKRRGSADVGLSRDFSFRNFAAPPARSPRGVDDGGLATYVARTSPSRAAGEASLACDAAPRGEPDGAEAPTRVRLGAESTRVLSNLVFFAWLRRQFADAAARLGCERVAAAMASVDHATFDDGSHDPAARQQGADGKVVASVTALLDAAAAARDDFEACLRAWAPGAALVKVRVKGARRSGEKAEHDYNARPPPACAWIHDALGAKLVFDTAEGLAAALDVVAGEADVLRVKNRFASPTPAGYRLCANQIFNPTSM